MNKLAVIVVVVAAGWVADARAAPGTGDIAGTVVVRGAQRGAGVVVYLEGDYGRPVPPRDHAVIRQREKQFDPPLTIVVRGTTIDFPNEDKVFHNVFSVSQVARFDFGLYKRGTSKSVEMKHSGAVDVYCNIHPEMAATILVLPNRRHTQAAADGKFVLDGVPPGDWVVFAYTRRAIKPASVPVTVKPGAAAAVDLAIVRGAEPAHLNKYGEKYHDTGQTYR
jgi:plastocyanin